MAAKEAKAHIKINKLLEESGWRLFEHATGKANIVLEPKVKLTKAAVDALGENFEDSDQIREALIHENYFSQKDIEACLGFDIDALAGHENLPAIQVLFDAFVEAYKS